MKDIYFILLYPRKQPENPDEFAFDENSINLPKWLLATSIICASSRLSSRLILINSQHFKLKLHFQKRWSFSNKEQKTTHLKLK